MVAVVIGIIGTAHHGNKLSVVRINNCMSKSHRLTHHPVALPLDLDHPAGGGHLYGHEGRVAVCGAKLTARVERQQHPLER